MRVISLVLVSFLFFSNAQGGTLVIYKQNIYEAADACDFDKYDKRSLINAWGYAKRDSTFKLWYFMLSGISKITTPENCKKLIKETVLMADHNNIFASTINGRPYLASKNVVNSFCKSQFAYWNAHPENISNKVDRDVFMFECYAKERKNSLASYAAFKCNSLDLYYDIIDVLDSRVFNNNSMTIQAVLSSDCSVLRGAVNADFKTMDALDPQGSNF